MQKVSELVSKNIGDTLINMRTWKNVMYNVLENGLVGDGTTDDTAALQALINTAIAAERRTIYFPHTSTGGEYYVTSLTNADQVDFLGDNCSFVGGYTGTIQNMGAIAAHLADFASQSLRMLGAKFDGVTDDTAILIKAHDLLPATGGKIIVPNGKTLITSHVTFTKPVVLQGEMGTDQTGENGCIILESDSGEITMLGEGSGCRDVGIVGAPGNTGNGINLSCSSAWAINLSAHEHGGNGIVVGSETLEVNANVFNLVNIRTKTNEKSGLLIKAKDGATENTNAGIIVGLNSMGNKIAGLRLENSHNNTFVGIHCETNNGESSDGITCINSVGNMFLQPYCEDNTGYDISFDADSNENKILGTRNGTSATTINDLGARNIILSSERDKAVFNYMNELIFKKTGVSKPGVGGYWTFEQNDNHGLEFNFEAFPDTPVAIDFRGADANSLITLYLDKLNVGGTSSMTKTGVYTKGIFDFGTVTAHSTKDYPITAAGVTAGDYIVVTREETLEPGLILSGFVSATDEVKVRMANITAVDIALSAATYRILAIRMEI